MTAPKDREALVELMARTIVHRVACHPECQDDDRPCPCHTIASAAILDAIDAAGCVVVPKDITEGMANEMECAWGTEIQWERALAASPYRRK